MLLVRESLKILIGGRTTRIVAGLSGEARSNIPSTLSGVASHNFGLASSQVEKCGMQLQAM